MKYDSRVISRPQAQPLVARTLWGLVTAAFWALYLYLWLPLVTLLLWLLGIRVAVLELYLREHRLEPFLLLSLPLLAVIAACVLTGWAELNRWRFAGRDKRSPTPPVRLEQIAAALGASMPLAQALQQGKVMTLEMTDEAVPRTVHEAVRPSAAVEPTVA